VLILLIALTTAWLVLAAMGFAAILEHAGFLDRLLRPIVARARSRGSLIFAVDASGIGLDVTAGDQSVADVLPARMSAPSSPAEGSRRRCSRALWRTREP
jgi:Na+/H+ antiporter NhaC